MCPPCGSSLLGNWRNFSTARARPQSAASSACSRDASGLYCRQPYTKLLRLVSHMKVTCTQEALARGLGIVGRAVATRSPMPITSNVLITSDEGRLKLSATNLEITISCWIQAQIDEEGAITVPARLLSDFVNTLPNDRISLTLPPRSRQVKLACARNEATIGGLDADDFPPAPVVKDGVSVDLDPKGLRHAIAQSVFAAATDDSRPVLTGVDTKLEGRLLTLAASDGFRLSVFKLP